MEAVYGPVLSPAATAVISAIRSADDNKMASKRFILPRLLSKNVTFMVNFSTL